MKKRKPIYVPLDTNKLWNDIKKHRKLYYVVLPLAFLLAFGYQLGQPDYYTSTVQLSPELGQDANGKALNITKIRKYFGDEIETDALFPSLYPVILKSPEFLSGLLEIRIHRSNDNKELSYYDYILNYQKRPWWGIFFGEKERIPVDTICPFKLTPLQNNLVRMISENVECNVAKFTVVVKISFSDSDPLVSAIMADSIRTRLQHFITQYHTQKATSDVKHYKKVLNDVKGTYKEAITNYASYSDSNRDPISKNIKMQKSFLEQEMKIQYDHYSSVYSQLIAAESKLQNETPSFAILESATIPVEKSGPDRIKKIVLFLLFIVLMISLYVFYKEHDYKMILGIS